MIGKKSETVLRVLLPFVLSSAFATTAHAVPMDAFTFSFFDDGERNESNTVEGFFTGLDVDGPVMQSADFATITFSPFSDLPVGSIFVPEISDPPDMGDDTNLFTLESGVITSIDFTANFVNAVGGTFRLDFLDNGVANRVSLTSPSGDSVQEDPVLPEVFARPLISPSEVPLPAPISLMGAGLLVLVAGRRALRLS